MFLRTGPSVPGTRQPFHPSWRGHSPGPAWAPGADPPLPVWCSFPGLGSSLSHARRSSQPGLRLCRSPEPSPAGPSLILCLSNFSWLCAAWARTLSPSRSKYVERFWSPLSVFCLETVPRHWTGPLSGLTSFVSLSRGGCPALPFVQCLNTSVSCILFSS